jgi:hypothetical protein
MPKGVCDPAPDPWHEEALALFNGAIDVSFRWTWDGESVFPDCDGPLVGARVRNTGEQSYYVHLTGRRGQARVVEIPPGTNMVRNAQWLSQRGLDTRSDLYELMITDTP